MKKIISLFKKFICKIKGHDFEIYSYMPPNGYYSSDCEKAGYCKRCGYDTHQIV